MQIPELNLQTYKEVMLNSETIQHNDKCVSVPTGIKHTAFIKF